MKWKWMLRDCIEQVHSSPAALHAGFRRRPSHSRVLGRGRGRYDGSGTLFSHYRNIRTNYGCCSCGGGWSWCDGCYKICRSHDSCLLIVGCCNICERMMITHASRGRFIVSRAFPFPFHSLLIPSPLIPLPLPLPSNLPLHQSICQSSSTHVAHRSSCR